MTALIVRKKLTVQTGTRIPDEWADEIDAISNNRAEFIREAIYEKLIKCDESYYLNKRLINSKKTMFSLISKKKTNPIDILVHLFSKPQAQKKPEIAAQAFSAHSSQG